VVGATFELTDRPSRNPDNSFRAIGDEGGLVVLPGRAEVKVLNPVAIKIYSCLDGSRSVREIVSEVTSEFDVSDEVALRHVREFLSELADHGMLAE
jgi:hypothetical protein